MPLETCTPWIDGRSVGVRGRRIETVRAPFDGRPLARLAIATSADLDAAIAAARTAFGELRRWPRHARRDLLDRVARALTTDRRSLAALGV